MEIKRVSYAFNSLLKTPFFLDVLSVKDGETLVDLHKTFKTKEEFDEEIERVVPLLDPPVPTMDEFDWDTFCTPVIGD